MTIWGGDFNCHLQKIDADGGRCVTKKNSVHKIETLMSENDLCDIWRLKNETTCKYSVHLEIF